MLARLVGLLTAIAMTFCVLTTAPSEAAAQVKTPPPLPAKIQAKVKALEAQVITLYTSGKTNVVPLRQKLLKLYRKGWGKKSPHLAQKHFDLAGALMGQMAYADARDHYAIAAKLFQQLHGRKHEQVATSLQMVAVSHFIIRDFANADKVMQETMKLREEIYGADSVMYATYLTIWSSLLQGAHSYQKAETLLKKSISILERLKGPNDMQLVNGLMQLGWLFYMRGDYKNGDKHYLRGIQIQSQSPGVTPGSMAQHWVTVGQMNQALGRPDAAKKFFGRAEKSIHAEVDRLTKRHGLNSPMVDQARTSLANLLMSTNRLDEAKDIFEALRKKAVNPIRAVSHNWSLATIATRQKQFDRAIKLYKTVIKTYKTAGMDISVGGPLSMIANTYRVKGDYKKALAASDKVRARYEKSFGKNHPITLTQTETEATVRVLMGQVGRAVKLLAKVHATLEPYTTTILAAGTEADNRQYLASIAYQLDSVLTVHRSHAPDNTEATTLAMNMILQRKGRLLDAVADIFGAMRRRMTPTDRKLLDQLRAARRKLSDLVIGGLGKRTPEQYQKELGAAETRVKALEAKIRKRSADYRSATTPVTIGNVAKAIPKDALLVEYIAYRKTDLKNDAFFGTSAVEHYAAYVLDALGQVRAVDLGPRKAIDADIAKLRKALADPNRDDARALAQKVYAHIFKPLETVVGQRRRLILSPDAATNLVPFAALVDDRGQFLVQRFLFSYVSSGRDLVRFGTSKAQGRPTIIANPNFDAGKKSKKAAEKVAPNGTRGRLARALRNAKWKPLPGTGIEAKAVAGVLKDVVVKTGEAATEAAIKQLKGPRILHIATHGFFLPDDTPANLPRPASAFDAGVPGLGTTMAANTRAGNNKSTAENPLLRSGLALGGANTLQSGIEDGVLTALEASDLDLQGTKLVVLSACETGVGEVRAGDGVHGLRRALVIAGAESLVMSLWQVDDEATKELMISYYRALERGAGRAEALRQVQLKMVRKEDFEHPFFWAAFIPAGKWHPLNQ